ncbi:MAG: phage tail protein, partial [Methylophagaceae bacterium]
LDLGVDFDVEWISVGSGVRVIENEDIVGTISIKDGGLSKSYNSLSASIVDPANNFNTRSVSFFNSDFLKQDRGVIRSGSYKLEGITNYHNARLAVEQTLNRSRFSRQVSFTVRPVGLALSPGSLIRVKYPRFGWDTGKYFRIQSMTYQVDCMVNIVATEHDDSIYFIQAPKASPYSIERTGEALDRTPEAPSALVATNETATTEILDGIELTWTKAASLISSADYEIWRSVNSDFSGSVKIATVPYNSEARYLDKLQPTTRTSYYYKIRTAQTTRVQTTSKLDSKIYYSAYIPSTAVAGTTQAKFNNYSLPLYQKTTTNVAPTKPTNTLTYTFSTNSLSGSPDNGWLTALPNNANKYSWRIEQPVSSITDSVEISTWEEPSLFAEQGADGVSGATVVLTAPSQAITYDSNGSNPAPSAAFDFTATETNVDTPYYEFFNGASSVQASSTVATYSYTAPAAYADLPDIIKVEVREGNGGAVVATDTFTVFVIKDAPDGVDE